MVGNFFGSLLGALVLIASAIAGYFEPRLAEPIYAVGVYVAWSAAVLFDMVSRPSESSTFVQTNIHDEVELKALRRYYLFIFFPDVARGISAILNVFRLGGILWGVAGLYFGWSYWVSALLVAYFFVSGGTIGRMDPVQYFSRAALNGNEIAAEQMFLISSISARRTRTA